MTVFFAVFSFVLAVLGFAAVRTHVKAFRLAHMNWDELVGRLQPVPISGIRIVARDYLQPARNQLQLEPMQLWRLVGGLDGLQKMYVNAEILIALASHAQRWNLDESVIVAERMRCDANALRRAVMKVSLGLMPGYVDLRGSFYLQEAASAYYLMRERLLMLYEASHAGRYSRLAAAVSQY